MEATYGQSTPQLDGATFDESCLKNYDPGHVWEAATGGLVPLFPEEYGASDALQNHGDAAAASSVCTPAAHGFNVTLDLDSDLSYVHAEDIDVTGSNSQHSTPSVYVPPSDGSCGDCASQVGLRAQRRSVTFSGIHLPTTRCMSRKSFRQQMRLLAQASWKRITRLHLRGRPTSPPMVRRVLVGVGDSLFTHGCSLSSQRSSSGPTVRWYDLSDERRPELAGHRTCAAVPYGSRRVCSVHADCLFADPCSLDSFSDPAYELSTHVTVGDRRSSQASHSTRPQDAIPLGADEVYDTSTTSAQFDCSDLTWQPEGVFSKILSVI